MLSQKKPANPFTERQYDNPALLDKIRQGNTRLGKQVAEVKQKLKIVETKKAPQPVLTRPEDLLKYNDVTVTRLLAKRFAAKFNLENYQKAVRDLQIALLSTSALLIVVSSAWLVISNTNFLANGDFAYNAGLLGGFLMLCSIFYALMKRIRFINALGRNETWFYAHLVCGIAGPLLIIFHTTFQIKSINSGVAFFCMLIVLLSGMFGRYIFPLLSFRTHRIYQNVGDVEVEIFATFQDYQCTTSKATKAALTQLIVSGLKKPDRWYHNIPQFFRMAINAMNCYRALVQDIKNTCRTVKERRNWDKKTYKGNVNDIKKMARSYIYRIIKLSMLSIIQNLLVNWRTFHANLLYLLALTATGHIVAVHMY
ncbi:hypothetical protein [Kaarinaea lacus]